MPKKRKVLDTSIFIRYFSEDDTRKAAAVEHLLKKAKKGEFELPDVAIAEMVWVLLSFYKLSKDRIIEVLEGLLLLPSVAVNAALLKRTIDFYRRYSISYIDAYLAAYAVEHTKSGTVCSFDEDFGKIDQITHQRPG